MSEQCVVLVGTTGTGKTTCLNIYTGQVIIVILIIVVIIVVVILCHYLHWTGDCRDCDVVLFKIFTLGRSF